MANTSGLKAQVIDIRNNQPIEGATLKLSGHDNQSTQTNSDGNFEFSNLTLGDNYHLDISASGYTTAHFEGIVVIENVVTDLHKVVLGTDDS